MEHGQEHSCIHLRVLQVVCLIAGAAWLAGTMSACIVSDSRCDAHQFQTSVDLHNCSCDPGYVLSPMGYGCVPCGANEEVKSDTCVCKAGFTRASDTGPCEAVMGSELGATCDAAQSCNGPNPYCALSEDTPYCTTQGCTRNDDCSADWRCDTSGAQSFCKKPPSGFGMHCEASADCAGNEAAFCETLNTHMCIVSNCVGSPGGCPSQSVCCDLTTFVGTSLCVATSFLTDGKCPGGGSPVMP